MSDLKTVLINDSRIEDISGEVSFAVQSGASQCTYQPYNAQTYSNSSHTWQIVLPSENIVTDRRILIDTDVEFNIRISNVPVGSVAFDWGNTDGFGPYPLNSCYVTQSVLINNNNLSVNTQDVMASLLRMNDQKIHTHYDGWTPSMVDDCYYNYSDAINTNNNPLSAIDNSSYDNKIRGRGSHSAIVVINRYANGVIPANLVPTDNSPIAVSATDVFIINIQSHLTEPILFLSPFISNPCVSNEAGFLGLNNMTFNFTLDSQLRRIFRTSNDWTYTPSYKTDGTGSSFSNLKVLVNYLSVQPSQFAKISARNILPLLQYNRYIPNGQSNTLLNAGVTSSYTSANIALNQVPDTILIFVRKPMSSQTGKDSDSFLTINKVSVNFNNVAGILASASARELWVLSQRAGSSQSWLEFSGKCNKKNANGATQSIATTGSILMLQPAYSFNIPDFMSASSLGSYNLQFEVNVTNQSSENFIPEIVIITITSGYMVTHQGVSQSFSGVLNREMVLASKEGASVPRISSSDYERLVGGSLHNRGVMNMMKHFKARRHGHHHPEAPIGGVMSGGDSSNRLSKYIR